MKGKILLIIYIINFNLVIPKMKNRLLIINIIFIIKNLLIICFESKEKNKFHNNALNSKSI